MSPGLVVTGEDSHSRGRGFKYQHQILDGHFSHYFLYNLHCLFVKTNKRKRGREWPNKNIKESPPARPGAIQRRPKPFLCVFVLPFELAYYVLRRKEKKKCFNDENRSIFMCHNQRIVVRCDVEHKFFLVKAFT